MFFLSRGVKSDQSQVIRGWFEVLVLLKEEKEGGGGLRRERGREKKEHRNWKEVERPLHVLPKGRAGK